MVMEVMVVSVLIVHHLGGFRGDHSCGPSIPSVPPMSGTLCRVTVFVASRLPTMRIGGI